MRDPLSYVVFEMGIYRHRIMGIFSVQEVAEERAREIAEDNDSYHNYVVACAKLDYAINDITEICRFRKQKEIVTREKAVPPSIGIAPPPPGEYYAYPVN